MALQNQRGNGDCTLPLTRTVEGIRQHCVKYALKEKTRTYLTIRAKFRCRYRRGEAHHSL